MSRGGVPGSALVVVSVVEQRPDAVHAVLPGRAWWTARQETTQSAIMRDVVKVPGPWPFRGRVIWLNREQGGRASGPPTPSEDWDYAHTAFVPPHTAADGLASFALRGFTAAAWTSPAEGRWLAVENGDDQAVEAGSVIVCTEGARVVAYFHVDHAEHPPDSPNVSPAGSRTAPSVS